MKNHSSLVNRKKDWTRKKKCVIDTIIKRLDCYFIINSLGRCPFNTLLLKRIENKFKTQTIEHAVCGLTLFVRLAVKEYKFTFDTNLFVRELNQRGGFHQFCR